MESNRRKGAWGQAFRVDVFAFSLYSERAHKRIFQRGECSMDSKNANDLIKSTRDILEKAGLTQGYIDSLNHTWKAFVTYCEENPGDVSKEYVSQFLMERYGIPSENEGASLPAIGRRRRRAMHIFLNCVDHQSPFAPATFWEYRFIDPFADVFSFFLDSRKGSGYALSTINRDIYSLNKFSEYLLL